MTLLVIGCVSLIKLVGLVALIMIANYGVKGGANMKVIHTCKVINGIKTFARRVEVIGGWMGICDGCEQEAYEQDQLYGQEGEIEAEFIMSWINGGGSPDDAIRAFRQHQREMC